MYGLGCTPGWPIADASTEELEGAISYDGRETMSCLGLLQPDVRCEIRRNKQHTREEP